MLDSTQRQLAEYKEQRIDAYREIATIQELRRLSKSSLRDFDEINNPILNALRRRIENIEIKIRDTEKSLHMMKQGHYAKKSPYNNGIVWKKKVQQ